MISAPGAKARASAGALLLAPGAGAGRDHHTLLAVEREVAPLPCARIDFPYRQRGSRAPDKAPVAVAHVRAEVLALATAAGITADRVVLGGRSYGGRMCSMAVAEGLPAAGLVLLSYPLHPPGKPESLRTQHFPQITVPVLMISGRADPFGTPTEFDEHIGAIPAPVTQVWLPGGHDPRGGDAVIAETVRDWIAGL